MNSDRKLHRKYQAISGIRSVERRIILTERILSIADSAKTLEPFDHVNPTHRTVLNFFEYLQKNCACPKILERRARWLGQYAEVVYHKLFRMRNTLRICDDATDTQASAIFSDMVDRVVESSVTVRLRLECSFFNERHFLEGLSELIGKGNRIREDMSSTAYIILQQNFLEVVTDMERVCGVIATPSHDLVTEYVRMVRHLIHLVDTYNAD